MAPASTKEAGADVKESRMNRYRVGDVVQFEDAAEWPPTHMEGEVVGFANDEGTYLRINFSKDHNDKDFGERVLTEDDVTRIG